jgi:ubiquinone/menaquinone biosynthesis C-methylase UbiE
MFEYYDRRAPEYDEWYLGTGLFATQERPGWGDELDQLCRAIASLPDMTTLDVACGTAFLTRHLRGPVTAIDQSERMVQIARERLPGARVMQGEAIPLPFASASFDRVFTGHFYGHLRAGERERFVYEARRVGRELVVVDSHERVDRGVEEEQERVLNDGSVHSVYKRYFTAHGLVAELGGGEVLHDGRWFVMVRSQSGSAPVA